ncbi:hypothetical protein [Ursidibacter arcticus]|nr:hypothetical protein A1D25_02715 [Ursidibacter arcticus]
MRMGKIPYPDSFTKNSSSYSSSSRSDRDSNTASGSEGEHPCSWKNFGKSITNGAITGAISGGIGGSIAPGIGTEIGAASGAVGGPLGSAAARYLAPRIGFLGGAAVGIADKK